MSRNAPTSLKATISSKRAGDFRARHAENGPVEIDVLPAGQLGMKTGADLEQAAAHPAALKRTWPVVGLAG